MNPLDNLDMSKDLNFHSLKNKIKEIYYSVDSGKFPGIMVDENARANIVNLEDAVVGLQNSSHIRVQDRFDLVPWLNAVFESEREGRRGDRPSKVLLTRRNGTLNGDYEINNVYYSSGELDEIQPPIWIRAGAAEMQFESNSYAKATNSDGNVRKYKNGIISLNNALICLDGVNLIRGRVEKDEKSELNHYRNLTWGLLGGTSVCALLNYNGCSDMGSASWWEIGLGFLGGVIGFPLAFAALCCGIGFIKEDWDVNKLGKGRDSGELSLSFCGHLAKNPIGNYY